MRISTRFVTAADRVAVLDFIRSHWSAGHVFVHCPEIFDWQYRQADGRFNMVFATADDKVLGILGFIPMGRFDSALCDTDVLLALWKVREDIAPPGLGLSLLKFVRSTLNPGFIGAIGISDMVHPIYRALGYRLDRLQHSAIFPSCGSPQACRIARGVPDSAFDEPTGLPTHWHLELAGRQRLLGLSEPIEALSGVSVPRKSFSS